MVAVPAFLPSSFVAEQAIEVWASEQYPAEYEAACPDAIAGQSPIDGLACATFIAEHEAEWAPIVAGLGLGG